MSGDNCQVILSHGKSGDKDSPILARIRKELGSDFEIKTVEFGFANGDKDPEEESDRLKLAGHIDEEKKNILVGKSYGGYISTQLAENSNVEKVIVLGFMLHPKNETGSTYPHKQVNQKVEFIIGDRDKYCNPEKLKAEFPDNCIYTIENADHSFRPHGENLEEVIKILKQKITETI